MEVRAPLPREGLKRGDRVRAQPRPGTLCCSVHLTTPLPSQGRAVRPQLPEARSPLSSGSLGHLEGRVHLKGPAGQRSPRRLPAESRLTGERDRRRGGGSGEERRGSLLSDGRSPNISLRKGHLRHLGAGGRTLVSLARAESAPGRRSQHGHPGLSTGLRATGQPQGPRTRSPTMGKEWASTQRRLPKVNTGPGPRCSQATAAVRAVSREVLLGAQTDEPQAGKWKTPNPPPRRIPGVSPLEVWAPGLTLLHASVSLL